MQFMGSMATGKKLLALALLFAFAAQLPMAATLKDVVTPYLYPGENYTSDVAAAQITAQGGQFVLVKVNGVESFFIRKTDGAGNETNYSFVNDTNQIYSALREYYTATSNPNASEIDDIISHITAFNASRNPREWECETSIGLDRPGATCAIDRCESCMSVPFCSEKIPYFGMDFTQSIHYFDVDVTAVDQGLTNATASLRAMKLSGADAPTLAAHVTGNLTVVQAGARSLEGNHVFGCYPLVGSQSAPLGLEWCAYRAGAKANSQWCRDLTFNYSTLAEAAADATAISGRVVSNASALSRAQAIYANMNSRANFLKMSLENATFRALYSQVEERASNASRKAGGVLAKITDDELEADLSALSELLLRVSQYGIDRNYTAANATSVQLFVLAEKVDEEADNLSAVYSGLVNASNDTSLSIFRARLYLDEQDDGLMAKLNGFDAEKLEIDRAMQSGSALSAAAVAEYEHDLMFIQSKAEEVIVEKQSSRSLQAGAWAAGAARAASTAAIGLISGVLSLDAEAKENYARTLPTVAVVVFGVFCYLACIAVFAILKARRRIRINRLSMFLWVVIFAFLFVLMGIAVAAANSIVQTEVTRSTFGLYSSRLTNASNAVIIVDRAGASDSTLQKMVDCSKLVQGNLSVDGKAAQVYGYSAGSCYANGSIVDPDFCTRDEPGMPALVLGYANKTMTTFRVFYSTRGFVYGNESFYSQCLISRAFD